MDISNNDVAGTAGATSSRRKSGRAIKVPEKFVPEVSSSQQAPPSAKRKRAGEDVENGATDTEEEDEDDASDGTLESAGEEEIKESRRKAKSSRKPAAKKPKVNGTVPHDSITSAKLPNRSRKLKKVAIADRTADGLYGNYALVVTSRTVANC